MMHISFTGALVIGFEDDEEDAPGAYCQLRPWLFAATVTASILRHIPGAEAILTTEQFTAREEQGIGAFPDCALTVHEERDRLNEDEVIIKFSKQSAVFLPRSRENLEAAAFFAWDDGIKVVRGLSEQRTRWHGTAATISEILSYADQNALCNIIGSYTEPELQIIDVEYRDAIVSSIAPALESWNLASTG